MCRVKTVHSQNHWYGNVAYETGSPSDRKGWNLLLCRTASIGCSLAGTDCLGRGVLLSKMLRESLSMRNFLVETRGFEPLTPCVQTRFHANSRQITERRRGATIWRVSRIPELRRKRGTPRSQCLAVDPTTR